MENPSPLEGEKIGKGGCDFSCLHPPTLSFKEEGDAGQPPG